MVFVTVISALKKGFKDYRRVEVRYQTVLFARSGFAVKSAFFEKSLN
jgi:hypothetical protein